ncbi:uncharacterized protein C3orf62 homolog isoform X2 [Sceloporus undulatus]|uniref:uncharacterized protein C3orf62 homolog isoform X2 n=1 Tax=Sceloporus undulatus TaxID=8520 RepID=UPI001C4AADB6|nr:uncharacterized protein C3orf62 homolog isoform X2 [Sceloporus undulatus]
MITTVTGEMSEKLSRCRKELAAAIGRAMEDLSIPLSASPNSATDQKNSDLLTAQSPTLSNEELFSQKGQTTPPTVDCPQLSLPMVSTPEKENPLLRPNLIPVTMAPSMPYSKREPLTSKENMKGHPPIFIADRQFFLNLEDTEGRKRYLSKIDETSMKSETSITDSDSTPQNLKDLADMSNNPDMWPAKLQRKLDFENELQEVSRLSSELFSLDASSVLDMDVSSFRKVLEYSTEDEAIIETLLDMEEEYRLNSSTLHQLH